eukprot:TRINITY_DN12552_c0_g1_i1.p1 TRINITY_DN12552_c0_g1~~TRINITY_DN12552_c0_g1_i1.p1  ORF type:complete len:296 (+),score=41.93 TRINITY_DN12552_c0_g1_i1:48-935(+)
MSTAEQDLTILIATRTTSGLSIASGLLVIISYIAFREARSFYSRLGLYLAICDTILFSAVFPGLPTGAAGCITQALFIAYFTLASVLWPFVVAITMFLVVVKKRQNVQELEKYFHLLCWGIPLLLLPLPFSTNSYGMAGPICWITYVYPTGDYWRFAQLYFWMWSIIITNASLYTAIGISISRQRNQLATASATLSRDVLRLGLYPLIMAVAWTPDSVRRIMEWRAGAQVDIFVLTMFEQVFAPSQGLFNALAYFLQPQMRRVLWERCCGCCATTKRAKQFSWRYADETLKDSLL